MNQHTTYIQPATPEVLAWRDTQLAAGCTRQSLYKSLLDAGWQAPSAGLIAGWAAEAAPASTVLASSATAKPTTAAMLPSPLLDAAGTLVDAGDKWVRVIEHRQNPEVVVFANFLSPQECATLMDAAKPRLSRSLTVDVKTGGEELHPDRTSQGMFFTRSENATVQRIEARIAKLLRWPTQNGEGLQVLRYPPGAEYRPHYDYFDPKEAGTAAILQRGGQRVGTLIMYLFEPEAGGATVFPDIDVCVAPKLGNAVFFSYAQPDPASRTLHGGEPVVAGEKWIATKWLREREFT